MARREIISRDEMLKQTRLKMQQRSSGRRDPDEFRCPTAKDKEILDFYFKILPPLTIGDKCKSGICEISNDDGLWYYENAAHFIDRNRYECPRIHDRTECPLCKLGFDLMSSSDDANYRKTIAGKYLSKSYYAVNIYFLDHQRNPEKLRGKIMWYNAARQVWDKWDQCINNDDAGDNENPKACGVFFHPYEGMYTFKLSAKKNGEYNSYENSQFSPNSFGPLVKLSSGQPDDEAIERILDQRFILASKFQSRDLDKLNGIVDKIIQKDSGISTEEIDVSEKVTNAQKTAPKAAPKAAPKVAPKVEEEIIEEEIIEEEVVEKVEEEVVEEVVEKPKQTIQVKEKQKPEEIKSKQTAQTKEKQKQSDIEEEKQLQDLLKTIDE